MIPHKEIADILRPNDGECVNPCRTLAPNSVKPHPERVRRTRARPLPPKRWLFKDEKIRYNRETGAIIKRGVRLTAKSIVGDPIVMCRDYEHPSHKRMLIQARVAWLMAYDEDPGPYQVAHRDGDRTNNRLSNLFLLK